MPASALQAKHRFDRQDLVAAVLLFLLFGLLLVTRYYGIGIEDELTYFPNVQRILQGDRMLVDIWDVSQLSVLFQIIPYKLCETLLGGTDGILPAIRVLFVLTEIPAAVYFYHKLKKYGFGGLCAVLIFIAFGPLYTFNYLTASLTALMIVCCALFTAEKPLSRLRLVGLGVILACAVLAEPTLAIAYFAYSAQVFFLAVRKKRGKGGARAGGMEITFRTWAFLTVGILLCAAAFFVFLLCTSDVRLIPRTIPELFTDPVYQFNSASQDNHLRSMWVRICRVWEVFNPILIGLLTLASVLSVILRARHASRLARQILFGLSCVLFAAVCCSSVFPLKFYITGFYPEYEMLYFSVPLVLFGLVCYGVKEKSPDDAQVFAFWVAGLFATLCVDFASNALFCFGGTIAQTSGAVFFFRIVCDSFRDLRAQVAAAHPELTEEPNAALVLRFAFRDLKGQIRMKKRGRQRRHRQSRDREIVPAGLCGISAVVLAALAVLAGTVYVGNHLHITTLYPMCEQLSVDCGKPLDQKLERGPLKGVRTNRYVKDTYDLVMDDVDTIAEVCDGPLYVPESLFLPYYLNLPCGSCSPEFNEEGEYRREMHYWDMYPERRPACIYIPWYEISSFLRRADVIPDRKLAYLTSVFDCEVITGKAGYILLVHGMRDLTANGAETKDFT